MCVNTSEFTQHTAKSLEQFLKGLSECGIIGTYTIQFLEACEFHSSKKAIIQKHINQLMVSLQILLTSLSNAFSLKYDNSLNLGEETSLFSFQDISTKEKESPQLSILCAEEKDENILISDKIGDVPEEMKAFPDCQSVTDPVKGDGKIMTAPCNDHCYIEVLDAESHQTRMAAREGNNHVVTFHSLSTNKLKGPESKDCSRDQEYLQAECSGFDSRLSESDPGQHNRLNIPLLRTKGISHVYGREANKVTSGSSRTIYADIVKLGPSDLDGHHWCEFCEKEFPSAGSLKRHLMSSHTRVLWCHTCLRSVNSKSEMKKHIVERHGDLPNLCCVCGKSFKSQSSLHRHARVHEGCRGTACEICGQTFSRSEYHKEHMRIHTGERPFKCEVCKKKFSKSSNLATHMVIHKPPEEGHLCSLCLKVFRRQDKLKEHTMRHLKIKRFVCKLCPKAYNEKRDLTKHISKVHILGGRKETKVKSRL